VTAQEFIEDHIDALRMDARLPADVGCIVVTIIVIAIAMANNGLANP
jgi:hypothetical protein